MRALIIFLCILLFANPILAQEITDSSILIDELERSYFVYVPESYDPDNPGPLLIVLHGSGSNGATAFTSTQFANYAEENGMIVVYPNGYRLHWFSLDQDDYAPDADVVNDVLFLETLIAEISDSYTIDSERIYATGYSSGGWMTLRLMCELPLAGVAIVSATATPELANHCLDLENPIDTLVILGTEDNAFPGSGSAVVDNGFLSIRFSFLQLTGFLATLFNCSTDRDIFRIDADSSPYEVIREYRQCANDTKFDIVLILGQDHAYPVAPRFVLSDAAVVGVDQLILDFFSLLP